MLFADAISFNVKVVQAALTKAAVIKMPVQIIITKKKVMFGLLDRFRVKRNRMG